MQAKVGVNYDHLQIENYVYNRLNTNDSADFEAEIAIDPDLRIEVARVVWKKMKTEKIAREQQETEQKESQRKQVFVIENKNSAVGIKQFWKHLMMQIVAF